MRGVGAIAVDERERRRLEGRYSRRDVARQRELLDAVLIQSCRHAGRYDDHDGIASCAVTQSINQSINQSTNEST